MPESEQVRAERELTKLGDALEDESKEFKKLCREHADAESDAKLAEAQAYVRYRNLGATQRDAEMKARIEAADSLRSARIAEARVKGTKEALVVYGKRMDEKRTVLVNMRPVA